MVDFEVGTGLRIQAAAVLAGPLGELLVTGGTPEFGSGASDVVDVAFEIGIFQAGLSLIEDGLVTAGLDNPSLVEGQGAEIAVAKTAPVGSEAEFDLAELQSPKQPRLEVRLNLISLRAGMPPSFS